MRATLFLRIAAVLTFIHAALHTIGGVFGGAAPGVQEMVVTAMKINQFPVMGVTRSYWDFYMGLGLGATVFMTMEAIVLWQLGSLAKTEAFRLRPIVTTLLVGWLAMAVNSFRYFFAAPAIFEVLIALCLGLAIASAKQAVGVGGRAVA